MVSSFGAEFSTALTSTSTGFFPVLRLIILKAFFTELVILILSPPLFPGFIRLFMSLSTMFMSDLRNFLASCLPPLWGMYIGSMFKYLFRPISLTVMPSKLHSPNSNGASVDVWLM